MSYSQNRSWKENGLHHKRCSSNWQNQAHRAVEQDEEEDSDPEPFVPDPVRKAYMAKELLEKTTSSTWFLDSFASRDFCNNRELFRSIQPKSIDFVIAVGQIIQTSEVRTVAIPLFNGKIIEVHHVAFTSDCNSNLISFDQLYKSGIIYHNK